MEYSKLFPKIRIHKKVLRVTKSKLPTPLEEPEDAESFIDDNYVVGEVNPGPTPNISLDLLHTIHPGLIPNEES